MAIATYSLHLPHLPHRLRRHFPSPTATSPSSLSVPSTSSPILTLDALGGHLASADFLKADKLTRDLLISLAGDAAQKRGYVFFSEVQFIAAADLQAIDELWREHSGGRFGYSVQRRLWEKARRDFTRFFINVGWMRRTESEVVQFNYRAFPDEFVWELGDATPEGHLPLTNALRGTQLLMNILTHPAFDSEDAATAEEAAENGRSSVFSGRRLKSDYSF